MMTVMTTAVTMAMARGEVKYEEGWEDHIGDLDDTAEPPRVFHANSLQPGNAFTRSLGDAMSIKLGIVAEAELLQKQLREQDQFVVLGSDGLWEFLSNQAVCDRVTFLMDRLEAAGQIKLLHSAADGAYTWYKLNEWMQVEIFEIFIYYIYIYIWGLYMVQAK